MTTLFPGGLDDFTNPTSGTQLSATGIKHHQQHTDLNDAVEALERYVGANGSVSGVYYSLTSLSGQITTVYGVISGSSGGGVADDQRLVLAVHTGLTAERVFTAGAGLSGTDAGAGSTYTARIYPTGVTSGTYYEPAIVVNAQGQLTFASDAGAGDGFVSGVPLMPRIVTSMWFADYLALTDRVYFTTRVTTGAWYYIDRVTDYPVLIATFSGRTPNIFIYSTIITGFLIGNGTSAAFAATVTGGIIYTGIASLGMEGGACVRTTVSGKTIYTGDRAKSAISVWDPASNTQPVTGISIGNNVGDTGRDVVFVSGVDSVFSLNVNSDIAQIDCTTNTVVLTISGLGLNLSAGASLTYNLNANRIFCCGTNSSANKTWYFTPGSTGKTDLDFPAGFHGSNGAEACYSLGNFVYFCTNAASPAVTLVLDAINLTWKHPLGVSEATATTANKPQFMVGIAAEGVYYQGTSTAGFWTYGRL